MHHSQHSQSFQPTEHPAPDRVDLIGCEVELDDGRCTFKCPIFDLRDLVVAEVTVRGIQSCQKSKHNGTSTKKAERKSHVHFLQLGKALKDSSCLQSGDLIVVQAAGEKKSLTTGTQSFSVAFKGFLNFLSFRSISVILLVLSVSSNSLQFTGGCRDVLGDLGELQVGAVDYIGLTTALGRTHWITVTGIIQTGVLCP